MELWALSSDPSGQYEHTEGKDQGETYTRFNEESSSKYILFPEKSTTAPDRFRWSMRLYDSAGSGGNKGGKDPIVMISESSPCDEVSSNGEVVSSCNESIFMR